MTFPPTAGRAHAGGQCRSCGSLLAADQRYCINCGSRSGAQRVESGPVLAALASASLAARLANEQPPVAIEVPERNAASSGAPGSGAAAIGTSLASKPATFAGMALLTLGMIVGAAFTPPIRNTLASGQRVIIVQAAGAPAQGPSASIGLAAEPPATEVATADPPVGEDPVAPPEPPPAPTPAPTPLPPTPLADPHVGHVFVVLLGGGKAGQTLVPSAARHGHSSDNESWAGAFDAVKARGFLLRGFAQISSSGFANRIALLTGMKPTPEMLAGCSGSVSLVRDGSGCIVPGASEANDLATLATQNLASKDQAVRAYVETPEVDSGDYTGLCQPVAEGVLPAAPTDGTPPAQDNPLLWIRGITDEPSSWSKDSILCTGKDGKEGMVRPTAMLSDDLRKAFAADSENFDPTVPSNFPQVTFIVPSRCRVDGATRCPDGTSGGPAALKRFLDGVIGGVVAGSDLFRKDGVAVVAWDQPPATAGRRSDTSGAQSAAAGVPPAVGALVLSPFVKAGGANIKPYDTYGVMRTIQERLGIAGGGPGHAELLGESAKATAIGREVFPRR